VPIGVALGDLNADEHLDLVVAHYMANSLGVLLGSGDSRFGDRADYQLGGNPGAVAIGDLDLDGHVDLGTNLQGAGLISVLLGSGDGSFASIADAAESSPSSLVIGDENGPFRSTVVVTNQGANAVSGLSVRIA
jgi:hypothetical protein